MGMAVGPAEGEDEAISAINTTPLVDVMLVLLIIFLITVPVVTTSIPVELPKERNEIRETKPENIDLNTWVTMSVQRSVDNVNNRLQDGLAFLATVGSTAPFVGLFGTVWGIYHALTAIGIAGQASIDKVAGPVGEALIMTAIGLAVAVPAVMGYNWLVRRNKVLMETVRSFGADVHAVLLGKSGEAAAATAARVR